MFHFVSKYFCLNKLKISIQKLWFLNLYSWDFLVLFNQNELISMSYNLTWCIISLFTYAYYYQFVQQLTTTNKLYPTCNSMRILSVSIYLFGSYLTSHALLVCDLAVRPATLDFGENWTRGDHCAWHRLPGFRTGPVPVFVSVSPPATIVRCVSNRTGSHCVRIGQALSSPLNDFVVKFCSNFVWPRPRAGFERGF